MSGYEGVDATTDNSWHHFKVIYTPPTTDSSTIASLSYIINDKTYDGTLKPFYKWDQKLNRSIDISKFMKNGNEKVRWGFTASTGSPKSSPSTYAVIMQEMPNVANVDTSTKLFDLSEYDSSGVKGREISDLDKKTTTEASDPAAKNPLYNVANGDSLRFEYNLKYNSGFAGTGNDIATIMKVPENIDFSADSTIELGQKGNIGEIVYSGYSNETDNETVPIPASSLVDGQINLNLKEMDSTEGQNAKIELFGKASALTTPTKVLGQHTSYKSLHFLDDVMSPSFIINDKLNLTTKDNLNLGTINTADPTNNSTKLNLSLNYDNGSNFDTKGVTLYTKVDDEIPTTTTISTADAKTNYDIANNIANSTQFNASTLGVGTHTITVYAVDYMKRTTAEIAYTVKVTGKQLSMTTSNEVSFRNINYQSSDGIIRRNGKWIVSVKSADTPWTLTASATPLILKSNSTQTIGPMIYRNKSNQDFNLTNETQIIASYPVSSNVLTTSDISGLWGNNDGVLLQNKTTVPVGTYSGKITWNLIDSFE